MHKFNQEQKSMKIPFVIYADTESLLEKYTRDNVNIVPKNNSHRN